MSNITLLNGDSEQLLKQLNDNSIDLVVTSPPYDDLREYNGICEFTFDKFKEIAKQLYRVVNVGGTIVWIMQDATKDCSETGTSFKQALYFKEVGFNLHDTMIWMKDTFSFPDKTRYRSVFEYMFVFTKGDIKTINLISDRYNKWSGTVLHGTSRGKDGQTFRKSNDKKSNVAEYGVRYNVWNIPSEKNNTTGHPAVFPERLATDHILSWSNVGDTVLDIFMGSGTTGISCVKHDRNFIGFEIDKTYYNIAKERIEEQLKHKRLF